MLGLSVLASACGVLGSGGNSNATAADIYSTVPSLADVRTLMGDNNWWEGPPSFEVPPLNSDTVPVTQRYSVSQYYDHIGTAEQLLVRYTFYDLTSSATTQMTDLKNAFGTSPTSPAVGDQVLYYGLGGSGATPIITRTFVRVGQVITTLVWSVKDNIPTVSQLGKVASKFTSGLKNLGKTHHQLARVDRTLQPPPGLDITPLGFTQLPVETFALMTLTALPDTIVALLRQSGITSFAYGDYALNNDTQMEVQTAVLTFSSTAAAKDWATTFSPDTPDSAGIGWKYVPIGGSPAAGVYHYVFSSGQYGGYLVCRANHEGVAASRECEDPTHTTAVAWKLALSGVG